MLTLTGTLLAGKYRVGARLGSGGMGEVYEGIQEDLGRKVAIKVMSGPMANDPHLLERFQREARGVAALGHPHIVAVTDFQDNPGEPPFIVMERLVGESLGNLLEREPMIDPMRTCRIAEQTLSALAAAHEAGLVHRDVKPDNIFLCRTDTNAEIVKLLDFGVAKAMEETRSGKLTSTGAIVGTLVYMAPEQARGEALDARADIYALGACVYHMLAGQPPFPPMNAARLLTAVCNETPTPLAMLRPDLDGTLVSIIARSMARDAHRRYPTARAMMSALGAFLRGEAPMTDPMSAYSSAPPAFGGSATALAPMWARTGAPMPYSGTPVPSTGPCITPQPASPYPYAHPGSGGGVVVPPYHAAASAPPAPRGRAALLLGAVMVLGGGSAIAGVAYWKIHSKTTAQVAPTTTSPPPVEIVAATAQPGAEITTLTGAASASGVPHVVVPNVPIPVATNTNTVNTPPSTSTNGMTWAQLSGQMTKSFQSGDGKACLDAYEKMKTMPDFSDPSNGYAMIRGYCLMEAGRCDDGRKVIRDYFNQPKSNPMLQQSPQQIEMSVSSTAQTYCPPSQLSPPERVQRAQILLYKAQSSKDYAQAAHYADEMAAQVPQMPRGSDEERRKVVSAEYTIAKAYGDAGRCSESRAHFHSQCSLNATPSVDNCVKGLLNTTEKCKAAP